MTSRTAMTRLIPSVCFMSMLAFSTLAMPSRARVSEKSTNAELIYREEHQSEIFGFREVADSRKTEILARELDESYYDYIGEVDVC